MDSMIGQAGRVDHDAPPTIVLVGGSPGVGKTRLTLALAPELGMPVTFVDDIQAVLERMTDPDRYPVVHMWRLHPEKVLALDDAEMLAHTQEYGAVISQALEPVIAEHLVDANPVLLEGDFILPSFAAGEAFDGVPAEGRVRGIFVVEELEQLTRNIVGRDGEDMAGYAPISWRYSEWLRDECARLGLTALPARPWDTVVKRALSALA